MHAACTCTLSQLTAQALLVHCGATSNLRVNELVSVDTVGPLLIVAVGHTRLQAYLLDILVALLNVVRATTNSCTTVP